MGFQVFTAGALTFLLMCPGLAFTAQTYQNNYNPENTGQSLHLTDYPSNISRTQGMRLLADTAKQHRVNLYQPSIFQLDAITGARLIYAFVGDPQGFPYQLDPATGQALEQQLPDFQPGRTTLLRPYTDAGYQALIGAFGFSGDQGQLQAFLGDLENRGFEFREGRGMPASPSLATIFILFRNIPDPGVILIFTVGSLLLAASTLHVGVRRYRVAALRRVEGRRLPPPYSENTVPCYPPTCSPLCW